MLFVERCVIWGVLVGGFIAACAHTPEVSTGRKVGCFVEVETKTCHCSSEIDEEIMQAACQYFMVLTLPKPEPKPLNKELRI